MKEPGSIWQRTDTDRAYYVDGEGKEWPLDRFDLYRQRIEIYEQAFRQIEIDNVRQKYFNEMATMLTIRVARRKLQEIENG